ncbi:MAG: hypothetical protein ABF709_05060 [Leuconostoc pseudomesenteroides]|uniref:hypothetical protein n=1 Tax=Leuconostoc pseudomesenteroides TaxID=33968 RepID=UPI001E64150D|nr:hypothetical protein [Leuconostoc pseudomesenteroides]MCC7668911.1 hypothetical protein [Leuconostoc pseudomesenteroides]
MFYITPTPTSWLIWLAMFAIPVIVVIAGGSLIYFEKMKTGISTLVIGSVALLVVAGLGISSGYYNYVHSSSYIKAKKTYKLEYDNKQTREIVIKDYTGKDIYKYTGKFSFDRKGHGLNLVDNVTGKKISIYIGDNDSVIVTDK